MDKNEGALQPGATSGPSSYRCENAPLHALLPFGSHAFGVHQLMMEDEFAGVVHNVCRAADWAILAAGLTNVVIETNGLSQDDIDCSNIYEERRGPAASAVATQMTRLLFTWGAVEALMESALKGTGRQESPPKRMCRLVDSAPALRHHDCASRNLLRMMATARDDRFVDDLAKVNGFDTGTIGRATFAAYQVRNGLAHGATRWPDDDSEPSWPTVRVAELASRVMLFAVQHLALLLVPPAASMIVWNESSSSPKSVPICERLRRAHLDR